MPDGQVLNFGPDQKLISTYKVPGGFPDKVYQVCEKEKDLLACSHCKGTLYVPHFEDPGEG